MAEEFEITDEMRKQIGKESPPWNYELTTTSVRALRASSSLVSKGIPLAMIPNGIAVRMSRAVVQ